MGAFYLERVAVQVGRHGRSQTLPVDADLGCDCRGAALATRITWCWRGAMQLVFCVTATLGQRKISPLEQSCLVHQPPCGHIVLVRLGGASICFRVRCGGGRGGCKGRTPQRVSELLKSKVVAAVLATGGRVGTKGKNLHHHAA